MGGGNSAIADYGEQAFGLSPRGRGKQARARYGHYRGRSIPAWAGETQRDIGGLHRRAVYPRVGGGNVRASDQNITDRGLSPRGRGKLSRPYWAGCNAGSIPAWAGETRRERRCRWQAEVYPRVGGGNPTWAALLRRGQGLSPRGRGKRQRARPRLHPSRSIPAWAGETIMSVSLAITKSVYPRVGGGNSMRQAPKPKIRGLSPRGRGKHDAHICPSFLPRSIPAWAGETLSAASRETRLAVYPRVGGGNYRGKMAVYRLGGLSPRGRGKPECKHKPMIAGGSIPAWAGETAGRAYRPAHAAVYPRVGGGNADLGLPRAKARGLSPRGRGKPARFLNGLCIRRSIPAWAGETDCCRRCIDRRRVYPRVGGGNDRQAASTSARRGLSPRGRGKPAMGAARAYRRRSIPAWAGETRQGG